MTDLQAWGWDWVRRAHLDQLEFKTAKKGETTLFEMMLETANSPDEKLETAGFEESVRKVAVGRVLLRTLDRDVQSFFPVAEVKGKKFLGKWKYRGANKIFGAGGKVHSAVGLFSSHPIHHKAPLISAFLPHYPGLASKLKLLSDYPVALELLPTHGVNLGTAGENAPKEMTPIEVDKREWFIKVRGVVTEAAPSYVLLDCGQPVFIEAKGFLNLQEGDGLKAEGALFGYPEP